MLDKSNQHASASDNSTILQANRDIHYYAGPKLPTDLIDKEITKEIERIRKCRFFSDFNTFDSSLALGQRLIDGDLQGGTNSLRNIGLSWCCRFLTYPDQSDKAILFWKKAKELGDTEEEKIAEAFILSKNNRSSALQKLNKFDSPLSRSAGFSIARQVGGESCGIKWLDNSGYCIKDLDIDGKVFTLTQRIILGHWDTALKELSYISEEEFSHYPVLHQLAATLKLSSTVPLEHRKVLLEHIPIEAKLFRLGSSPTDQNILRQARVHYDHASKMLSELQLRDSSLFNEEFSLWLELRSSDNENSGNPPLN